MDDKRSRSAHTPGNPKGEEIAKKARQKTGHHTGEISGSTPKDFTGINPQHRKPIDPNSPTLITA